MINGCAIPRLEGVPLVDSLAVGGRAAVRAKLYDACGALIPLTVSVVSSDTAVVRVERVLLTVRPSPSWPVKAPELQLRAVGAGEALLEYHDETLGLLEIQRITVVPR